MIRKLYLSALCHKSNISTLINCHVQFPLLLLLIIIIILILCLLLLLNFTCLLSLLQLTIPQDALPHTFPLCPPPSSPHASRRNSPRTIHLLSPWRSHNQSIPPHQTHRLGIQRGLFLGHMVPPELHQRLLPHQWHRTQPCQAISDRCFGALR